MSRLMYFFFATLLIFHFSNFASSLESEQMLRGIPAPENSFKHICAIVTFKRIVGTCFILGDKYVGSAAHVVEQKNGGISSFPFKIVANFQDVKQMQNGIHSQIANFHIPTNYTSARKDLDIAIFELRGSLELEKNGLPALKIPPKNHQIYNDLLINSTVSLAGYGYDVVSFAPQMRSQYHEKLTYTTIQIMPDTYNCCNSDAFMCAKPVVWKEKKSTIGPCQADSGTVIERDGYALLVLSANEFIDHNRSSMRSIFVKVGHHADWINDVINGRSNNFVKRHPVLKHEPIQEYDDKNDHQIIKRSIGDKNRSNQNSPPPVTARPTEPTEKPTASPLLQQTLSDALNRRDHQECMPKPAFSVCPASFPKVSSNDTGVPSNGAK